MVIRFWTSWCVWILLKNVHLVIYNTFILGHILYAAKTPPLYSHSKNYPHDCYFLKDQCITQQIVRICNDVSEA